MLELWRPPGGAGEPIGCLATTYTFEPGLFDEQCLARFLEIESEPDREDLAFLLGRETRLGGVYAGVLVDHTQAGVEHSLRWDVLPVRIPGGKQHAKLSLLAWTSANLTEAGYRYNREVAVALDIAAHGLTRDQRAQLNSAIEFLRCLLAFVPAATHKSPEIQRATSFLEAVERQASAWPSRQRSGGLRQYLVFSLPARDHNPAIDRPGFEARSTLEEAIELCRKFGRSPDKARIASPFFDCDGEIDLATKALCLRMAKGRRSGAGNRARVGRRLWFAVPCEGSPSDRPLRLAAPRSLLETPRHYSTEVDFELLPQDDEEKAQHHFSRTQKKERRFWHAKMIALRADNEYYALLVGSSNFTRAGLGIGSPRNAEANVLSVAKRREVGDLKAIWPKMDGTVDDPDKAEWLGPKAELDEEQQAPAAVLPVGFLSATYRAGEKREIVLQFDVAHLPESWAELGYRCRGTGPQAPAGS